MKKLIEDKNWYEYTKDEQKELLEHWWVYYGKMLYTGEELEIFNEMVEKIPDQVLFIALISYLKGYSSQPLLQAIREDNVDGLISLLPSYNDEDKEIIDYYKKSEQHFISILVKSYNNPEPDVPMKLTDVITQRINILKKRKK